MALDWRDIKAKNIKIVKALDSDGNELAVAEAGWHHEFKFKLWYGCSWESYQRNNDLS